MKVIINKLPETIEEFKAMPQADLSNPANTCAMFLCACELFISDRDAGREAMDFLRGPRPMTEYDMQFLRNRFIDKKYLPKVYFEGASPDNNYEPRKPSTLEVYDDTTSAKPQPGYLRLFLETAGADRKRPITLRGKGDKWYLWEYSSILLGVVPPKAEDPWA